MAPNVPLLTRKLASVLDYRARSEQATRQVAVPRARSQRRRRPDLPPMSSEHVPSGVWVLDLVPSGKLPISVEAPPAERAAELREKAGKVTASLQEAIAPVLADMRRIMLGQVREAKTSEDASAAHNLAITIEALESFHAYGVSESDGYPHLALKGQCSLKGERSAEWSALLIVALENVLAPAREEQVKAIKAELGA